MAPRLESFFRETASGLRRNGVAFAAMSTSFIALFLFGLSLLIAREFELVTRVLTGNVEVQVYLTDPVNEGTVGRLTEKLQQVPAVADVAFWDKERSCQEFQRLFEGQEVFLENVDCMEVIPTSLRVNLSAVTDFGRSRPRWAARWWWTTKETSTRNAPSPASGTWPITRSSSIASMP